MTLTVVVPSACVPSGIDPDPRAGTTLPGLGRLAAQATVGTVDGGVFETLCAALGIARQDDWPLAPFAARGDGLEPTARHWQFADPVQTALTHTDVTLTAILSAVVEEDAAEVLADLNGLFAADGLQFVVGRRSGRWYVGSPRAMRLATTPPRSALGASMRAALPGGDDAATWRRWASEIQMLLHEHPVNRRREARGDPRIDALWLWGGGTLPADPVRSSVVAFVDDPSVRCIVEGAGGAVAGGTAEPAAALRRTDAPVVVWLDALARAADRQDFQAWRAGLRAIDTEWFGPLADAARGARAAALVLGGRLRARRLEVRRRTMLDRLALRARRRDGAGLLDDPSDQA